MNSFFDEAYAKASVLPTNKFIYSPKIDDHDKFLLNSKYERKVNGLKTRLRKMFLYYMGCTEVLIDEVFPEIDRFQKDGMNDAGLFKSYFLYNNLIKIRRYYSKALDEIAKYAQFKEGIEFVEEDGRNKNIFEENIKFDKTSYLDFVDYWNRWVFDKYIESPIKSELNVLKKLENRINQVDGNKWLKKTINLDYRILNASNLGKKVSIKKKTSVVVKKMTIGAFRVLSALNIFSFIGSFIIEYLSNTKQDEIAEAYLKGKQDAKQEEDNLNKIFSEMLGDLNDFVSLITEGYINFFEDKTIKIELKKILLNELEKSNEFIDLFFQQVYKDLSNEQVEKFNKNNSWVNGEIELLTTYSDFSKDNISDLQINKAPKEYFVVQKEDIVSSLKPWLIYNTNNIVKDIGPRDNDYWGPESIKVFNSLGTKIHGKSFKKFKKYLTRNLDFAKFQVKGFLYRSGCWNTEVPHNIKNILFKELKNKDEGAYKIKIEFDSDFIIQSDDMVMPNLSSKYLSLYSSDISESSTGITIKVNSITVNTLKINQAYTDDEYFSALNDIDLTCKIAGSTNDINFKVKNDRNYFDDF